MLKGIVVGAGRSGTTMLINLIGQHSMFSPMYELEFLPPILNEVYSGKLTPEIVISTVYGWASADGGAPFKDVWDKEYDKIKPHFGSKYYLGSRNDLVLFAMDYIDDLREMSAESATERWLNKISNAHTEGQSYSFLKCPSMYIYHKLLLSALPGLKFINIYRDGRDVYDSVRKFWWGKKDPFEAAKQWISNINGANAIPEESIIRIKYEDFLKSPQDGLEQIFSFLGVDNEEIPFEPYTGSIGRYKKNLTNDEINKFNKIAGDKLIELGYEV